MTPRDELKSAVMKAMEDGMVEFARTVMEIAFQTIESHAGGCVVVPRRPDHAMIAAGRRVVGQTVGIIIAANAASPYAPEA